MKLINRFILVVFLILAVPGYGAQKFNLKNEIAYLNGKAMFKLKPAPHLGKGHNYLMSLKGKVLAHIIAYGKGTNVNNMYGNGSDLFIVSFPSTGQGVYMGIDGGVLEVLNELYVNGVLKKNGIAKKNVGNLAKKRYAVMNNMGGKNQTKSKSGKKESAQEFRKRMGFSDPSKASRSKTSGSGTNSRASSSSVSFTIKNECRKNVKVFIGAKPKYGSGVTGTLSGNSVNSRRGKAGEQVCIVDDRQNPISCMKITNGMGRVSVNRFCTSLK